MGVEIAKEGKLLYHLTKLKNLDSIVKHGLMSRKELIENKIIFGDIADIHIISKRQKLALDMYIPFHFHPYTAFDYAVKQANTKEDLIYLCVRREDAAKMGFQILPKHPLSKSEYHLYDYEKGFQLIDWDAMTGPDIENDAKQVKMAECLSKETLPISSFHSIYVRTELIKDKVSEILKSNNVDLQKPYINVNEGMFREHDYY